MILLKDQENACSKWKDYSINASVPRKVSANALYPPLEKGESATYPPFPRRGQGDCPSDN